MITVYYFPAFFGIYGHEIILIYGKLFFFTGQKNTKASDRIKYPNEGFKQAFSAYITHGKTPHRGLIYFKKKQSGSQGESTTMW